MHHDIASFPSTPTILVLLFLDTLVSGDSWGPFFYRTCMCRLYWIPQLLPHAHMLMDQASPDLMFDVRGCCLGALQSLVCKAIVVALLDL
jgi:hypothetical protein